MKDTESLLKDLADICNETNNASFTLSRLKDSREWTVRLVNKWIAFSNADMKLAITEAIEYVEKNRKPGDKTMRL